MRKASVLLFVMMGMYTGALGQLQPLVDQYTVDGMTINPAYTGSQEALSITSGTRMQWVGFEGAPRTLTLAAHTPLRNKKVNVGILMLNDKLGSKRETGVMVNYAYRIDLASGKFSFGLAAGFSNISNDLLLTRYTDPDDQLMMSGIERALLPEFSMGIYYYADDFFAGLSMPLFLTHYSTEGSGRYTPAFNLSTSNYVFMSGYVFHINDMIDLFPSILIRSNPANVTQADLQFHFIYNQRFWIGASARTNGNMTALVQLQANPQLRIGYAYGHEFSSLSSYQQGTHELVLRYTFRYVIDVLNPRYF